MLYFAQPSLSSVDQITNKLSLNMQFLIACLLCCPEVHNAEFILTGVLTQKLNYDSYPLQSQ